MFAGALFDMDGLLLDSERAIMRAWMQVARERAVRLSPARYATVVGRNVAESTALLAPHFGGMEGLQQARQQVQALLQTQPPEERFALKPGVAELLAWLAAREVPCAVASSSSRHEIEHRLALAGVRNHFRAVAGGDEVPAGKPDQAVYLLAAERTGLRAPDCIAFEDSPNGARAALAAGAALVLVPDLVRPPVALARRSLCVLGSLHQALPQAEAWFPPEPACPWPQLGPASRGMLQQVGITRLGQLRRLGAVRDFHRVRRTGAPVSLNLLWALEAALSGLSWQEVAREHRTSLLLALEQMEQQEAGMDLLLTHPRRKADR